MKWKDLSLKERKQIYDSVRVNNPDATYFDIKEQFDSIPEYEDGKADYTPEERAWVARRTVELGMEGKPAPQDSLYTIVDRAKVQNKPKKYDPTDSAIEQGKQVLSGLNKTVGTALTGASLATMGLWNAARLLNVGTGSSWRLWAAKNALTGANAGLAADVGSFIEDPSITNAVQVGLSKVGSKDLTTTSNKIVNTISSGFDFDDLTKVPAYQDGGKSIVDEVNKSDANFVQRLKSPTRQTIPNWEDQYRVLPWEKSVSTHKLSVWDNANGGGTIVPDVQEVNGKLIDFTRPPYNNRAAVENALKTGDYVDLPKYEDALWYTENYKRYYPRFEDGGKNKNVPVLPKELGLTPGTPEYLERQKRISGSANVVQPEAYITPAGYIKDAVNFIEDLGKGDYAGAAMDAVLNLIPWGVGKGIKKLKSKVGRIVEGTEIDGASVHSFAPTQTKKKTKKKTEEDYDSEFSEVLRKDRNSKKYQQEISRTIEQAIFPDERTRELVENVDKTYGTNYKRAYSNIAYKDMTKRGSYVKWGDTDKDGYGQINIKNIKDNILPTDINDYSVILDNNIYMPGTANHELGHVADGLAGSRKIQDFDSGKEYITNTYLNYLANSNNTYSSAELRKMGLFDAAGSRSYLLNPTEAKSHMLTLKRSLKDSGKITNWSTPVDENMILEYMRNPTSNKMVKNQYDLYRNKNEYIDRLNKLIPMEILMPLGGAGFVGHELNKE